MHITEPDDRRHLQAVLWATAMLVIAFLLIQMSDTAMVRVLIAAACLAVSTLVTVPAVSGNRLSLAFGGATAIAMLVADGSFDLAGALSTIAIGFLAGWLLYQFFGDEQLTARSTAEYLRQSLGSILFAVLVVPLSTLFESVMREDIALLCAFLVGVALWFLLETSLWALSTYGRDRLSRRYLFLLAIQDWPVASSLFVVGALFAFSWSALGWWTLPIAVVPYSFAHVAFRRSHVARITYGQTIRALSRIPEVAHLSPRGHSDRTAELAVSVAQELGMSPDEVQKVEYAARMHDIGRITLNEPNIIKIGFTEYDIARWGAEVIAEAPYLADVASLVRQQHNPYRRPGEQRDPNLPMASKIIKASSAFDHATNELGFSRLEALEVLHRGAAYDFDPDVVDAVRDVVESMR
ncbi:MAG: HD domain-containing protein [Acidimicrobiia bacterium]|nr:HD domain-containing protein [Acidimicrobiia bacterium]